jgi:hypothetical protein
MLQIIHRPAARRRLPGLERCAAGRATKRGCKRCSSSEREAGFDLLNQAPFHLRLIRVGEARYWFMMSNHHILIDAWCRSLLMSDFLKSTARWVKAERRNWPRRRAIATTSPGCNSKTCTRRNQWWQRNLQGFERTTYIPSDRPFLREHAGDSGGMLVGDCYTRLRCQ